MFELTTSSRALQNLESETIPDLLALFRPPPKLTISEWADQYRVLSTEYSPGGHWETSAAEYQREIMDEIGNPLIEEVSIMKSARSGGTQCAIDNPIGYWIHQDPGPILVGHTTVEDGKTWSKDHLETMIRDCPVLRGKIDIGAVKDKKNTILHKSYPGGIIYIIGSNSAAGFRQKTIQRVLLDDVDGYELTAGEEGDQIALARKRTLTYMYHHRKIVKVSTPTTRGLSRIEKEFTRSDMRFYFCQCPHCRHHQFLRFSDASQFAHLGTSQLLFDKENLSWVYYPCENCQAKLEEKDRPQMIRNGEWRKTQTQITDHAGFHISEMFSPFSNFKEIAKSFLEAKHMGMEHLRVFINQTLGETFVEDKINELNNDQLGKRKEEYTDIPPGVLVLTAAVDKQADRFEVEIQGWGKDYENWHIKNIVVYGQTTDETTWRNLFNELEKPSLTRADGVDTRTWTDHGINCIFIDSSDDSDIVYRYVKRLWKYRMVFAIKGDKTWQKEFITQQKQEKRYGTKFVMLCVNEIKRSLMSRLMRLPEEKKQDEPPPPNPPYYYHFNQQCGEEFFKQLLAEKIKPVRDKKTGAIRRVWHQIYKNNEILDLYVYNIGAVTMLKPNFEALAAILQEKIEKLKDTPTQTQKEQEEKQAATRKRFGPPKKNWAKDW